MKAGAWRTLRLVAAAIRDAICPQPSLGAIAAAGHRLTRHLREPPRRRAYLCGGALS